MHAGKCSPFRDRHRGRRPQRLEKQVGGSCHLGDSVDGEAPAGKTGLAGRVHCPSGNHNHVFPHRLWVLLPQQSEFPASQNRNLNLLGLNAHLVLSDLHGIIKFSQSPHLTDDASRSEVTCPRSQNYTWQSKTQRQVFKLKANMI